MSTASYIPRQECKAALDQVNQLAEFILKFYPGELGRGNKPGGEAVADVVIRLLSPTESANDTNARVPNWAVDTLAKKELRRLAQFVMETYPSHIGEGGIVDTVIRMLTEAYKVPIASN